MKQDSEEPCGPDGNNSTLTGCRRYQFRHDNNFNPSVQGSAFLRVVVTNGMVSAMTRCLHCLGSKTPLPFKIPDHSSRPGG